MTDNLSRAGQITIQVDLCAKIEENNNVVKTYVPVLDDYSVPMPPIMVYSNDIISRVKLLSVEICDPVKSDVMGTVLARP